MKNDKKGWDITGKKVVWYSYTDKGGSVFRSNGLCVGNHYAGDFKLASSSERLG